MSDLLSLLGLGRSKNPYLRSALKAIRDPNARAAFSAQLPRITETFQQAADVVYHRVILEQFRDYEARYDSHIVDKINEAKRAALMRAIISFMLYAFFRQREGVLSGPSASDSSEASLRMTYALHFEIYKAKPAEKSFIDYLTYRNPNFEDAALAPAFKFGNDLSDIIGIADLPFSFMASQQAMILSEITRKLLEETGFKSERSPS